jgi:ABC-type glutathione transport system ATPase component
LQTRTDQQQSPLSVLVDAVGHGMAWHLMSHRHGAAGLACLIIIHKKQIDRRGNFGFLSIINAWWGEAWLDCAVGKATGDRYDHGSAVTSILEVRGLRKSFGPVDALLGADLALHAGEVLALVGDNGAGKSTLIKHISGVYKPDAGQIMLAGEAVSFNSPGEARERGIETVYQDLALADDLSVGANVFLGREQCVACSGFFPSLMSAPYAAKPQPC